VTREAFLKRAQQAAEAGRAHRVALPDIDPNAGYTGADGALPLRLGEEVENNGGTAHVVVDHEAAREKVASLLKEHSPQSALCWNHPVLDRLDIAGLLATHAIALHDINTLSSLSPAEQRRSMLAADIGITSADLAIAETGSLVMRSRPGRERVASLLPPFHLAIVERAQIVADLFDAFAEFAQQGYDSLPSNLVFVSGPSKTGDIELQLTTGVHGPGRWHVIVVAGEVADEIPDQTPDDG